MIRFIPLLFAFSLARAQFTVTTVAGGASELAGLGMTRDSAGDTYLCAGALIIRLAPDGTMTPFAGTGVGGYSPDGVPGIAAQLGGAFYCAVDPSGNLVISDQENYRIRRIDSSGIIHTIVGTGVPGDLGDGDAGTSAQIGYLTGLAIDRAGDLYFSDGTYVRQLTASGVVRRIAGNVSTSGSSGDGGPALSATFASAAIVTVDSGGNVYCADNRVIRRIATDGTISTVAGSQSVNSPVQDGMAATSGYLQSITALATDSARNLLIGGSGVVRRVDATTGTITTIAGGASQSAPSQGPALSVYLGSVFGIWPDPNGTIWLSTFAYPGNELQTFSNSVVTTVASVPEFVEPPDGAQAAAVALATTSIAVSRGGDLYIGEVITCAIRKVGADGKLSTVPGTGNCNATPRIIPESLAVDSKGNVYVSDTVSTVYSISPSSTISAVPVLSGSLAVDSQDRLYVAERNTNIVRLAPGGTVQTLVGDGGLPGYLSGRIAIALDSGDNLFIATSDQNGTLMPTTIFRMDSSGTLTRLPGSYADGASSMAVDGEGDIWLVDYEGNLSGSGNGFAYQQYGSSAGVDGPLLAAGFASEFGLQSGSDGAIYVIQQGCNCVRKISGAPPTVAPAITTAGVVNAASLAGGPIAPGELISIFGSNLGVASLEAFTLTNNSIPTVLRDIEVLVNGAPVSITAVSPQQINAFVPYTIAGSNSATLSINAHGALSATLSLPVATSAFGLFTADGSGVGQGAILNQDGSYNGASNPAPAGSVVSLFGTGEGGIIPYTPSSGLVISTPFPTISQPVSVIIAGQPAQVLYAGAAPLLPAGIAQINVAIPAGTPPGQAELAVTVGETATVRAVTLEVK